MKAAIFRAIKKLPEGLRRSILAISILVIICSIIAVPMFWIITRGAATENSADIPAQAREMWSKMRNTQRGDLLVRSDGHLLAIIAPRDFVITAYDFTGDGLYILHQRDASQFTRVIHGDESDHPKLASEYLRGR